MVFNLSKKDPATRHVLKTKLSFKSFWKYLREIVCTVIPLLQNFRSIAYNLHICGKVKACSLNIMSNLGKYRLLNKLYWNMEMKAWTWLRAFPSFYDSHKFFPVLVTFYSKFTGYFSDLDFHVILHVILILQHKWRFYEK